MGSLPSLPTMGAIPSAKANSAATKIKQSSTPTHLTMNSLVYSLPRMAKLIMLIMAAETAMIELDLSSEEDIVLFHIRRPA